MGPPADFVGAALDKQPFYRNADPLGALNLVYYDAGRRVGVALRPGRVRGHADAPARLPGRRLRVRPEPAQRARRELPGRTATAAGRHDGRHPPAQHSRHAGLLPRTPLDPPGDADQGGRAAHERGALVCRQARPPAERSSPKSCSMGAPPERVRLAPIWPGSGGVAERVTIGVADGRIASLAPDSTPPPDATHPARDHHPGPRERALPCPAPARCAAVPRPAPPTSGRGAG